MPFGYSMEVVVIAVVAFSVGFVMGSFLSRVLPRASMTARRATYAAFITLLFASATIWGMFNPSYTVSVYWYLLMGAVFGWLYGIDNPIAVLYGGGGSSGVGGDDTEPESDGEGTGK